MIIVNILSLVFPHFSYTWTYFFQVRRCCLAFGHLIITDDKLYDSLHIFDLSFDSQHSKPSLQKQRTAHTNQENKQQRLSWREP